MKFVGAFLVASIVGATIPENNFTKTEILALAKTAIVKDYAKKGVLISRSDIDDKPMEYTVHMGQPDLTVIELGLGASYISENHSGIPDYCSVRVEITETTKEVTNVDCGQYD